MLRAARVRSITAVAQIAVADVDRFVRELAVQASASAVRFGPAQADAA